MQIRQQPSTAQLNDDFAAALRGFGPLGLLAFFLIAAGQLVPPLSAVLVFLWRAMSHTPWREIGYTRPRSWIATLTAGITFGITLKFLMKAIVMPLLGAGPANQAFHYLAGNAAALPAAVFTMIVVAGLGEETVFRGYLFERLGKLIGAGSAARVATILLTSVVFGALHYVDQGLAGAQQATITGLVFGGIFVATGQLWVPICAHAAFDLTAVALIYWDLEATVAHWVF